ncbi:hypothetical protein [Rhodovulum adriaticum]|nr:hypothetical protein [Rhodovulum adriaticum]MBK1636255.1 hypothetical protein [Rhodovulum adriaticum]
MGPERKVHLRASWAKRIYQGVFGIFFYIVGKLGDIDFVISAGNQDSWFSAMLRMIADLWPWIQPALMILSVFAILLIERKVNSEQFARREVLKDQNQDLMQRLVQIERKLESLNVSVAEKLSSRDFAEWRHMEQPKTSEQMATIGTQAKAAIDMATDLQKQIQKVQGDGIDELESLKSELDVVREMVITLQENER